MDIGMVSKWKDDNRDTRTKIEEGDNNNNVRNKDKMKSWELNY